MTEADLIPQATFKDLIHQKFEKLECESSEEVDLKISPKDIP